MSEQRDGHVHISRSTIALGAVAALGAVLTFVLPSTQAENMVQVGTDSALVGIVLRVLATAGAAVNAALRLADELNRQRASARAQASGDRLAQVVQLPQRGGRSDVS